MKLPILLFTLLLTLCAHTSAQSKGKPAKLFILSGQSNMEGVGGSGALPAELAKQPEIQIRSTILTHPDAKEWQPLGGGFGVRKGFGPEVTIGHELSKAFPDSDIFLIKSARSGTPLSKSGKVSFDPAGEKNAYDDLVRRVNAALADLESAGRSVSVEALFWMQGEADAVLRNNRPESAEPSAERYGANLRNFITTLRKDLELPKLPVIAGRLPTDLKSTVFHGQTFLHAPLVIAGQEEVAGDPAMNLRLVNTDDIELGGDKLHYNAKGQMALGRLFAQEYLELVQGPAAAAKTIIPRKVDSSQLAFYPDRWKAEKQGFDMMAWEGEKIAFLTMPGEYDPEKMTRFVGVLDRGWATYAELIGTEPRPIKRVGERSTITAVKNFKVVNAFARGYVGGTGIEVGAFYSRDWAAYQKNPEAFQHYYFYEMGRNYFVFGDRHSLFTTGYAVFMRNVCMDALELEDPDIATRKTIEGCEAVYAASEIPFLDAFTNLGQGEKANRLKDAKGKTIVPSDQPVMVATAMLYLREKHGGDEWVKAFYHNLRKCDPYRAGQEQASAMPQVLNWLVSASLAAKQDLSPVFCDRWRLKLSEAQRKTLQATDWKKADLNPATLVTALMESEKAEAK